MQILSATAANIAQAAAWLQAGQLVAMPTETVYGLAANARSPQAVAGIFTAKGRPQDNPLIVHVHNTQAVLPLVTEFPPSAAKLAAAFWPGPLTLVLPKSECVPSIVSAGLPSVALRIPNHPVALALLRACDLPLAAPSANRSGAPSPTTAQHVAQDLQNRIPAVLNGGACTVGLESTVLSLCGAPTLLRPGGITLAQIEAVLQQPVALATAITAPLPHDAVPQSPGMKYRHYAPAAKLTLAHGPAQGLATAAQHLHCDGMLVFNEDLSFVPAGVQAVCYGSVVQPTEQATQLFAALRTLDAKGLQHVLVHAPPLDGIGLAVYNRLIRACQFCSIDLLSFATKEAT